MCVFSIIYLYFIPPDFILFNKHLILVRLLVVFIDEYYTDVVDTTNQINALYIMNTNYVLLCLSTLYLL